MDGWILGNIIFGGVIGDVVRGAGFRYPPNFKLVLDPASFSDEKARDDWYSRRMEDTNKRFDKAIEVTKEQCESQGDSDGCSAEIKGLEKKREKTLEDLEKRRAKAVIFG